MVKINEGPTCLAMDLGGTKLLIGEVDEEGNILRSKRYPSRIAENAGQREVLASVVDSVIDYVKTVGLARGPIRALGMGAVGRVNNLDGVWLNIDPARAEAVPAAQILSERFGAPCTINNDVRCAVSAEQELGWGRKTRDYIYINVGTGIAAGTVIGGKVVTGASFHAGEIGHQVVSGCDAECFCGRVGCVEAIASGIGMDRRARQLREAYPDTALAFPADGRCSVREIFSLADRGDRLCGLLARDAAGALAETIMDLVAMTDPDTVVLGGGVVADGWLLRKVREKLHSTHMRFVTNGVVLTELDPDYIALIGAAMEGINEYKQRRGAL
jgi:glucokinase